MLNMTTINFLAINFIARYGRFTPHSAKVEEMSHMIDAKLHVFQTPYPAPLLMFYIGAP